MMEEEEEGGGVDTELLPTIEEMLRMPELIDLDEKSWEEKLEYAAFVAQPILDRDLPARFPHHTVHSLTEAAMRVLGAAKLMLELCGFGAASEAMLRMVRRGEEGGLLMKKKGGPVRREEDIVEWRDVWTHPELYRRVYSNWLGSVYQTRSGAIEEASARSQRSSLEAGPSGTHWTRKNRGASPASMGPYKHFAPERFGHPTSLVHVTETPSGSRRRAELQRHGASYVPSTVVRLSSVEWYLKGFLPSVLLWTHLAMVETPRIVQQQRSGASVDLHLSVYELVAAASLNTIIVDGQEENYVELGEELRSCWWQLEAMLGYVREDWLSHEYNRVTVLSPSLHPGEPQSTTLVPDMIRVPQELWHALSKNRGGVDDTVRIIGLSNKTRWTRIERASEDDQWEYATMPDWIYSVEDADRMQDVEIDEGDERTEMIAEHRKNLDASVLDHTRRAFPAMMGLIGSVPNPKRIAAVTRYLANLEDAHHSLVPGGHPPPPERYLPLPKPPHPVPALYIPWTFTATIGERGVFESVMSLESVRVLNLKYVGISCLETGLAIEEWGSSWNRLQRDEQARTPTHREVLAAIRAGQSVPGIDIDFPLRERFEERLISLRELRIRGVFVLDPDGPMGRGHRIYSVDTPPEISVQPNWPRRWRRDPDAAWLRFDRVHTVEYLSVTPPTIDLVGRWEDSGIEAPQEILRNDPRRHRPLRFFRMEHVATPDSAAVMREYERSLDEWAPDSFITVSVFWEQAHWQVQSRIWVPTRIDPWPVHANLHKMDTSSLDTAPIAKAPVIRELSMRDVVFPRPMWVRELLEYPREAPGATFDFGPDQWLRFLDSHGAPMSLMPSARATLLIISVDGVRRYGSAPELLGSSIPDAADFARAIVVNLFPGVPLPARQAIADRELVHTTRFRHYPNLNAISLVESNLVDIPWGLLDLLVSGTYNIPLPSSSGSGLGSSGGMATRVNPPPHRRILCDLSANRIREFSTLTWVSLVLLVKTRHDKVSQLREMRRDRAHRHMQQILVNMMGNPIVDQVRGLPLANRDAPFLDKWRAYVAVQLDVIAEKYHTQIEAVPRSDQVCCPAVTAMRFWKAHRSTVVLYLSEMFVLVRPEHFAHHMVEHFRQLNVMRNLWMI